MIQVKRFKNNPILTPNENNEWESYATFNASVVINKNKYHMLYRAMSEKKSWQGEFMHVSSIGYAQSSNGYNFTNRKQFITPQYDWEKFGVEDPRTTFIDERYVTFYTSISSNPPGPKSIRLSVAISRDFEKVDEKHLVTPFNAKAMTLFPEIINGKYYAILTVDTDNPPSKIAIASVNTLSDFWDKSFWQDWYENISKHTLPLQRRSQDQVEVGLSPIKTEHGWLLIYSYIQNYFTDNKVFGIEAVLLDVENPLMINGKTKGPFMTPETYFEKHGNIPNIIFPSGGVDQDDNLRIYYGASDTTVCTADISISEIIENMEKEEVQLPIKSKHSGLHLTRFDGNPILSPLTNNKWEEKAVLNTGVYKKNNIVYLFYRAMDNNYKSSIGLALSDDGYHIKERFKNPIYEPRVFFEKNEEGGPSGCEDPRITQIEDTIYMIYVAYDGKTSKVAITSIKEKDFLGMKFNWTTPYLISDPNVMDKNSALFPEKINNKFAILHRLDKRIWLHYIDDLKAFNNKNWLGGIAIADSRDDKWDSIKIGIAGPPVKTDLGWLLIYHGISKQDKKYRLGIMILDLKDPAKIILRLDDPILEPKLTYESSGVRPGTVFSCGSAILNDKLFVYYGAGDSRIGVSQIKYSYLLEELKKLI